MTALYTCASDYEFQDVDKLYCSKKQWIGKQPACKRKHNNNEGNIIYNILNCDITLLQI